MAQQVSSSGADGLGQGVSFPQELMTVFWLVFGGLVWILIASSQVPLPLLQGWVMFASVFCFVGTTALLFLYLIGAHGGETSWVSLDAAYHSAAALFYLSSAILEALAMILMEDKVTYEHYLENIFAAVSAPSTARAHFPTAR
nr:myelin and lymphocyte protein-like [Equus asinus]